MLKKIFLTLFTLFLSAILLGVGLLAIAVLIAYPKLPDLDLITRYQPKMPLMIYSADGQLIGVYGEERRSFTPIDKFPDVLVYAVIAAEDKRFYEHWGVDLIGVARAALSNLHSGKIESGASTITQQVARNFFLTNERSFTRKFNEALMAYKIERSLSKAQILELYFNQIYLGQRSYGFAAASRAYFNKPVSELDIAEAAMLAGLPKAPSAFNPKVNPKRAKARQLYILGNMLELNMITKEQYEEAKTEELHYESEKLGINTNALYVAEMTRQLMYEKYGDSAYTNGFRVYTTVDVKDQEKATEALRNTLKDFDKDKSFQGAESFIDFSKFKQEELNDKINQYVANLHVVGNMIPAIVTAADKDSLTLRIQGEEAPVLLKGKQMAYVSRAINNDKFANRQIRPGAVVRVIKNKDNSWTLTQIPELQGALISIDANTGAIRAMVGGYDFYQKEFNRATQALRQPGSTFKPFVYSAALDKGMTTSTLINDAPLSLPGLGPRGTAWEPQNSDGKYNGLMTMHQALTASKNLVSVRILMAIGTDYAHQYVQRFGFSAKSQPKSLTMTLGAGSVTPLEMARAYSVFANGGYRVAPYIIDRIYDDKGNLVARTEPLVAAKTAPRVIDERNAFIMYQMMKDVTRHGTAATAYKKMKRDDIAGKTGTTNDQKDAWFVGYTPSLTTAVYIGFDKPRTMGRAGFGGRIALPVWIDYMSYALKDIKVENKTMPQGVVNTGGEYYYQEWQFTNPALAIDNRAEDTEFDDLNEILPIAQEDMQTAPQPQPTVAAPPPNKNNGGLENLF
ncbi:MAG: penicillin-binding protein 1A [Neisseriaceae bacterium]|nr:penicillin-binding protein 1A [Neisseriaceae bacterium]